MKLIMSSKIVFKECPLIGGRIRLKREAFSCGGLYTSRL